MNMREVKLLSSSAAISAGFARFAFPSAQRVILSVDTRQTGANLAATLPPGSTTGMMRLRWCRKRPLTLPIIRRLHEGLGIPAESLIRGTDAKGNRAA